MELVWPWVYRIVCLEATISHLAVGAVVHAEFLEDLEAAL